MAFQTSNSTLSTWIKRLISWSVFLLPITYIAKSTLYPFISFKTLVIYLFIEIVFFLWLYAFLVKKEVVFRLNVVSGSFLIFIFVVLLSSFFSVDPSLSFWSNFERMNGALTWLHLGALFVVASSVFKDKRDWLEVFWSNSISATIIASIAILGSDGFGLMDISKGAGSLIGNTSFAGSYLLISFFLMAYLWIEEYKSRGVLAIMMITIFITPIFFGARIWNGKNGFFDIFKNPLLILGQARAASISLYLGMGAMALGGCFVYTKKKFIKQASKILLILTAIVFLSTVVMFFISNSPVRNFLSAQASKSRVLVWESAVSAWKTRPLLGYGIGTFTYVYQDFYQPEFLTAEFGGDDWMDKAHSVGYEILATTGSLGALSFASMYVLALIFLWRRYRRGEADFWESFIPSVLLIIHLLQNLTVFDTVTTYQLFTLIFAFVASRGGKEIQAPGKFWKEGVGQSVAGFGLLACLIFFVFIPYGSSNATINFSKGEFITSAEATDRLISKVQSSRVGETEKIKLLAEMWRGQIVQFPQIIARYPENVMHVQDVFIEEMEKSMVIHPDDLRTSVTIARTALFSSGMAQGESKELYVEKAHRYASLAIEISPEHQLGYWTLASVENSMGNREEAYRLAKIAYDFAPTAKTAAAVLAQYE